MSLKRDQIIHVLSEVRLPAQKANVVEANLVSRLDVQENSVFIEYQLPELNPTFQKSLEYQTKKVIAALNSDAQVQVEFIQATPAGSAKKKLPQIGSMIAIGSGKGGVGKSSVTVNLAMALKKLNYKVGILDCDVYGPSIPTMMGVEGAKPMVVDQKIQTIESNGIQLMSAGFFVEEGQGLVWRGPMIHKLIQQFYGDVNWDGTDVLLIDLPPGTGDAPLSISQTMPLTGALMVSLPQKVSIVDVDKAFSMFQSLKVPVLGVVENMAEYSCPSCGHTEAIFSRGGVKAFCEKKQVPFLGEIPIDPKLRELSDLGKPYFLEFESTAAGKAFMEIAKRLQPMLRTADDLADDPIVKIAQ